MNVQELREIEAELIDLADDASEWDGSRDRLEKLARRIGVEVERLRLVQAV